MAILQQQQQQQQPESLGGLDWLPLFLVERIVSLLDYRDLEPEMRTLISTRGFRYRHLPGQTLRVPSLAELVGGGPQPLARAIHAAERASYLSNLVLDLAQPSAEALAKCVAGELNALGRRLVRMTVIPAGVASLWSLVEALSRGWPHFVGLTITAQCDVQCAEVIRRIVAMQGVTVDTIKYARLDVDGASGRPASDSLALWDSCFSTRKTSTVPTRSSAMYADVLAGGISGLYTDVGQARRVQISPAAGAIDLVPLNGCLIALKTHSLVLRHLSMSGLRLDGAPGLQPLLDVFVGVRWPALRTFELSLAAECRSVGCDGLARVVATNCEHIECLRWERAPVRPSTLANLLRSLRFLTEIHVSIDDSHDGPLDALQTRLYDAISESMLYDDAQPHDQWRYSQHVPLTPHSARASIVASIPATPRTPSHLAPPSPRASLAMPPASPQKPQQLPPASPRKSLQMPPVSPRLSSLAPASASASASASTSASASALIVPTSTSVPTLIAPASVTPASASASAPVHHRRSSVAQPTIAELAAAADALGLDNDDDYAFLDNEAALLRPSRRSFADPASEGLTVPARGFASRSPLLPASPAASAFDGPLPSKPVGFRRPRRTSEQQSSSRVDSMRQSLILPPIYQISYHRHRPPPLRILRFLTISVFDAGHAAGAIASGSVSWLRDLRALLQQAPLLGVDVNVVYRAERHSLRGPATTSGRVRQADRAVGRLKANLRLLFT